MTKITDKPKFLIVGTGGIGGYYGGMLARQGCDVTFLARGAHYEAIKAQGLRIQAEGGEFVIHPAKVVSSLDQIDAPDVVLFCVKTYDTESTALSLAHAVKDETIIISIQNGIENDLMIKRHIKNGSIYPGLAYIISTILSPGVIRQTGAMKALIFGDRENNQNAILGEIAALMQKARIDTRVSSDILVDIWEKFVSIVAFSGFTAFGRCSIGRILNDKNAFPLYKRGLQEAIAVARAAGVRLTPDLEDKIMARMEKYRGKESDATSSLMRDVIQVGHKTEIETLSGTIACLGDQYGIDVPIHKMIYAALSLAA